MQYQRKKSTQKNMRAEEMNRHFSKEDIQVTNRHKKKMLKIMNHQRMQVKIKMNITSHLSEWYYKKRNNKCWWGQGEKGALVYRRWCGALYQGHRCRALHQCHLWNWPSTVTTIAMSTPDLTSQIHNPILGKNTHPNQSPNATLPAGIFLVLRL